MEKAFSFRIYERLLKQTLSILISSILISSAGTILVFPQPALAQQESESLSRDSQVSTSSVGTYSDFNGDGYDDLAIGIPLEDVGSVSDAGAVNVIYGSSASLRTSPASDGTGKTDQFWHQNRAGVEDSAETSDMFGFALAAGNFNGDNFMDLAIGVPGESVGSAAGAGAVNVLYGSAAGLRTSAPSDQLWTQNSVGVDNSAGAGDGFGSSLVAGDFNGDGKDDLAIGVPNEDIGAVGGAGAVSVLYGSLSGLRSSSPADQLWHQGKPGVEDVENFSDHFGFAISSGDYNNDAYEDLAIGVPGEDIETNDPDFGDLEDTGGLHVLYGSSSGLQTSLPADQFWNGAPEGEPDEFDDTFPEHAGVSVASGDFNNDGYDDLAVGVPGESRNDDSCIECGAVNVLYGSATGLESNSSPGTQFWDEGSPGLPVGGIFFGWSLAAGDFNNDGRDDLAIGSPEPETVAIGTDEFGAVSVIYGSASGLQTNSPAAQLWHQDRPSVDNERERGDFFGTSLITGDYNGDGRGDLAIGVPGEDIGTAEDAGAVNLIHGTSVGLRATSPADQFWHQGKPGVEDSEESGDGLGSLLTYHRPFDI
jgi:hypothetical protein